jgi:phosphatidylglycerol:prolipoprotein diacylglycerol transferase
MEPNATSYPLLLTLGSLVGILWILLAGPEDSRSARSRLRAKLGTLDSGLAALMGGLVSARTGYVLLHLDYYRSHGLEALAIWQGGLVGWSAIAGALLFMAIVARWREQPFWTAVDSLAIPGTFLAFSLWLGCLADGCAYGRPLEASPWAIRSANLLGRIEPRWPTQSLGAILSALSLVPLFLWRRKEYAAGSEAALALTLQAGIGSMISLVREDPVTMIDTIRMDSVAWFCLALIGLAVFVLRQNRE